MNGIETYHTLLKWTDEFIDIQKAIREIEKRISTKGGEIDELMKNGDPELITLCEDKFKILKRNLGTLQMALEVSARMMINDGTD